MKLATARLLKPGDVVHVVRNTSYDGPRWTRFTVSPKHRKVIDCGSMHCITILEASNFTGTFVDNNENIRIFCESEEDARNKYEALKAAYDAEQARIAASIALTDAIETQTKKLRKDLEAEFGFSFQHESIRNTKGVDGHQWYAVLTLEEVRAASEAVAALRKNKGV